MGGLVRGSSRSLLLAGTLWSCDGIREAGTLDPVHARAPERLEVRALSRGATFGQILWDAGLDADEHAGLLLAFAEQANPRRMRLGTEVRLRWRGEPERLAEVEVGLDRDRTVVLEGAGGGWVSSTVTVPVEIDTVFGGGRIESTLWSAVLTLDALRAMPRADRIRLVGRMDRVFQWRIDFSRQLMKGDSFRFSFERETRSDGSTRSGRLLAAQLVNGGRALHAIWFAPGGDEPGDWYDLEGRSVRRAFLKKPLALAHISSGFTNRRFHPVLRTWRPHRGVDYAAGSGSPVEATGKGVVVRRGWSGGYGRVIDIRHANGFLTRYAHLSAWAGGTAPGSRIDQGQVIGYVGMTGMATGPHLHYEMHRNGRPVDPLAIDVPSGEPVAAADRVRWERERDERLAMLLGPGASEVFGRGPATGGPPGDGP